MPTLDSRLRALLHAAVAGRATPGAAVAAGGGAGEPLLIGCGRLGYASEETEAGPDTVYDLASLTKPVATATLAMLLASEGALDLDRPVRLDVPELDAADKAAVTPRLLLLHRAGLDADVPFWRTLRGTAAVVDAINRRPLRWIPGTRTEYSDPGFILLGRLLERLAGEPLDALAARRVCGPLGMDRTRFRPPPGWRFEVAPTERQPWRGGVVRGEVHDENAWAMGGVAGHAGLFGTARDLATFARWMLRADGVERWTRRHDAGASRALGWDTPSPGSSAGRFASPRAFGHTGFTGCSLWIDPVADRYLVLLTNRVHPVRDNPRIGPLRRAAADAVFDPNP